MAGVDFVIQSVLKWLFIIAAIANFHRLAVLPELADQMGMIGVYCFVHPVIRKVPALKHVEPEVYGFESYENKA